MKVLLVLSAVIISCIAQRSPYAGRRPIGYPEVEPSPEADQLEKRLDADGISTTTEKLPLEALGDRELFKRLSKLPIDQQPFWLINWRALEEQRQNPQSYPQRDRGFNLNSIRGFRS